MPYPTTLILLAVIVSVTVLGWQATLDGQAVTAVLSSVVAAVTVGHYVKTSGNGSSFPPGTTKTVTTPESTTTSTAVSSEEGERL